MWRAVSFILRPLYSRENNPRYQLNGMMVVLQSWTGRFEVKRYRPARNLAVGEINAHSVSSYPQKRKFGGLGHRREESIKIFLKQVRCSVLTVLRLIRTGSIDERQAGTTTARKFGTSKMVKTA